VEGEGAREGEVQVEVGFDPPEREVLGGARVQCSTVRVTDEHAQKGEGKDEGAALASSPLPSSAPDTPALREVGAVSILPCTMHHLQC
jgi:hypothetical protein